MADDDAYFPEEWVSPIVGIKATTKPSIAAQGGAKHRSQDEWESPSLFLQAAESFEAESSSGTKHATGTIDVVDWKTQKEKKDSNPPSLKAPPQYLTTQPSFFKTPEPNNATTCPHHLEKGVLHSTATPLPWWGHAPSEMAQIKTPAFRTSPMDLSFQATAPGSPVLFSPISGNVLDHFPVRPSENERFHATAPESTSPMQNCSNENPTEITTTVLENDVVVFGTGIPRHANVQLNRLVRLGSPKYETATDCEKDIIVHRIINKITSLGGRFLKKASSDQHYVIINDIDEIYGWVRFAVLKNGFRTNAPQRSLPPIATVEQVTAKANPIVKIPMTIRDENPVLDVDDLSESRTQSDTPHVENSNSKRPGTSKPPAITAVVKRQSQLLIKRKLPTTQTNISKASRAHPSTLDQLQGVRVSITRTGTFEVRYKPLGKGKNVFPKFIGTAKDRETAVRMGNFVADLLTQNSSVAFDEAKRKAVDRFKKTRHDGKENVSTMNRTSTVANDCLFDHVAQELLDQDEEDEKEMSTDASDTET